MCSSTNSTFIEHLLYVKAGFKALVIKKKDGFTVSKLSSYSGSIKGLRQ